MHPPGPRDRARDGKVARALGHADDLREHLPRRLERGVDVPQGAGAAEAGKREAPGAEALGHVARPVHPDEEERDPPRPLALQRGHAVRGLFVAGAEAVGQQLDVVAGGFAGGEEPPVGHHHRRGEVVGKADPQQRHRRRLLDPRLLDQPGNGGFLFQPRQQDADLEAAAGLRQQFRQHQFLVVRVEATQLLAHDVRGQDPGADLVARQALGQRQVRLGPVQLQFPGHAFRGAVQFVDVVAARVEPSPHRIHGARAARQHLDLVAVGQRAVLVVGAQHGFVVAFVQAHEGRGEPGRRLQHRLDLCPRQRGEVEDRVLHRRAEIGRKLRVDRWRQLGYVEVIDLGQLHQQLGGCRALVRLDQGDVARRHAKLGRHLRLRQPQRPPQHLEPLPDDELFRAIGHA